MRMWTLTYDENKLDNFPQVLYKGNEINIEMETKLLKDIFKIFYLTHRDEHDKIKSIENNTKKVLPYKDLLELIVPGVELEFETEYFVELLNYFNIEIDNVN